MIRPKTVARLTGLGCLGLAACIQPMKLARDDSSTVLAHQAIDGPSPGTPGTFVVRTLYYGSGTDRRRREFRDSVAIKTGRVDASKLAKAPNDDLGRSRRRYWGFGFDSLPINGRVWYPEGAGPFPLVLIVHGNHNMEQFSDPGYGWLGRHLASRGYILASVDENFLNGDISGENDARGMMLLEHLKTWRRINDSAGTPLRGKVDLGNIALMGHSRGGEAVAIAGLFNRLAYYPDNATVKFDYQFAIKSLVAIAPIDGQYEPADRPTPLENVNYLVIHGSHDGDVSAFSGLRQYYRIRFTDGGSWFKSAIWMYRANHGQWNTVWNNHDWGRQSGRYLDLRGLIDPEAQREFGRVAITAFLDATLKNERRMLPLFRDYRSAGAWLPKTLYVTRFMASGFHLLAGFGEDVDLTTGTAPGVRLSGDSLGSWRESTGPLRWPNTKIGQSAAWLGWNNRIEGDDTTKRGRPASFSISVPDSLRQAWKVGATSSLLLTLAPIDEKPDPRKGPTDSTKAKSDSAAKAAKSRPKPPAKAVKDSTPIELSIEAVDAGGDTARVSLSRYGPVRMPPEVTVQRRRGVDRKQFGSLTELVLQTFVIPLADFTAVRPAFRPDQIATIRLVFDRTVAGTVVVTDVGVTNLDPGFDIPGPRSTP